MLLIQTGVLLTTGISGPRLDGQGFSKEKELNFQTLDPEGFFFLLGQYENISTLYSSLVILFLEEKKRKMSEDINIWWHISIHDQIRLYVLEITICLALGRPFNKWSPTVIFGASSRSTCPVKPYFKVLLSVTFVSRCFRFCFFFPRGEIIVLLMINHETILSRHPLDVRGIGGKVMLKVL